MMKQNPFMNNIIVAMDAIRPEEILHIDHICRYFVVNVARPDERFPNSLCIIFAVKKVAIRPASVVGIQPSGPRVIVVDMGCRHKKRCSDIKYVKNLKNYKYMGGKRRKDEKRKPYYKIFIIIYIIASNQ